MPARFIQHILKDTTLEPYGLWHRATSYFKPQFESKHFLHNLPTLMTWLLSISEAVRRQHAMPAISSSGALLGLS
eukprot:5713550-Amphidinium_carterae.1